MYLEVQLTIKGVLHVYMYHHTTVCKLNKVRYFICWVSDIIKLLVIISWSLQSNHKDTFFLHVHVRVHVYVYLVICYPSYSHTCFMYSKCTCIHTHVCISCYLLPIVFTYMFYVQ